MIFFQFLKMNQIRTYRILVFFTLAQNEKCRSRENPNSKPTPRKNIRKLKELTWLIFLMNIKFDDQNDNNEYDERHQNTVNNLHRVRLRVIYHNYEFLFIFTFKKYLITIKFQKKKITV